MKGNSQATLGSVTPLRLLFRLLGSRQRPDSYPSY